MRRLELAANILFGFGPFAIGMLLLVLLQPALTIPASFACFGIGVALLLHAKSDLFKRRIWFSFGTAHMNAASRHSYLQAYGFIVAGTALNLIGQLTFHHIIRVPGF